MAKIRFKCTCNKVLAVEDQFAGKVAKCPNCGQPVQIPSEEEAQGQSKPDIGQDIGSLSEEYERLAAARERRERAEKVLAEVGLKRKKQIAIGLAAALGAILVIWIFYTSFRSYGPTVGLIRSYPEPLRPVVRGLRHRDPDVRAAAAWELADLTGDEHIDIIAQMIDEQHPLIRMVTLRALYQAAPDDTAALVEPLLGDRSLDIRMTAAFLSALAEHGELTPESLRPYLSRALERDPSSARWFDAVAEGGESDDDIQDYLQHRVHSTNRRVRAQAAWMIAAALGPDSMLLRLVRDPEPSVRQSAIYAAGIFLSRGRYEVIEDDPDLRARNTLMNNVGMRIEDEAPREVRRAAALALAHCGQDQAASLLVRAIGDDDWFVRFAGAKGLEKLTPSLAARMVRGAGIENERNEWTRRILDRIRENATASGENGT